MVYYIVVILAWLVFRIGFRVSCVGKENLIKGRGFILAPNHISAVDPVFIVTCGRWWNKMRVFSKGELYEKNRLLSWFLYQIGCVPVKKGRDDVDTINRTVEECKNGKGLLIFPEGTRTKTGEIGEVKLGVFVVAAQAAVDIVPCRIIFDTPDGFLKLFCRVRVCFGEPIPAELLVQKGEKRDRKQIRENKERLLHAWENLYQANKFD